MRAIFSPNGEEIAMPLETIEFCAAVLAMFGVFGVTLAWNMTR